MARYFTLIRFLWHPKLLSRVCAPLAWRGARLIFHASFSDTSFGDGASGFHFTFPQG
jgi:hypothetical protein